MTLSPHNINFFGFVPPFRFPVIFEIFSVHISVYMSCKKRKSKKRLYSQRKVLWLWKLAEKTTESTKWRVKKSRTIEWWVTYCKVHARRIYIVILFISRIKYIPSDTKNHWGGKERNPYPFDIFLPLDFCEIVQYREAKG